VTLKNLPLIGGLITALAASLCCVLPAGIAILGVTAAGSSLAFAFEPYRPFMIGVTILLLGFAWWSALRTRPAKDDHCGCETGCGTKQTRKSRFVILTIASVFALAAMAVPYALHAGSTTLSDPASESCCPVTEQKVSE
jgi:hypothetical protein